MVLGILAAGSFTAGYDKKFGSRVLAEGPGNSKPDNYSAALDKPLNFLFLNGVVSHAFEKNASLCRFIGGIIRL